MDEAIPAQRTMQISFPFLLSFYLILPIFLLMFLVDKFAFAHPMSTPRETYFFLGLLFGTPHIVASNVILFTNSEYLSFYKWRVIGVMVFVAAVFTFGGRYFSVYEIAAMNGVVTVVHTAKQQLGIGNILGRLSGPIFHIWLWSAIAACVIMNNEITVGSIFSSNQAYIQNWILIGLCCVVFLSALILNTRLKTTMARNFFWANTSLALISLFFFAEGYYLFAMFSSRIVHDLTAFSFYIMHDHNKHSGSPKNRLYAMLQKLGFGASFAVPVIAILLAFSLPSLVDSWMTSLTHAVFQMNPPWQALGFGFVTYIGLIHYFTESFTWKGASPYRKYVSFKI